MTVLSLDRRAGLTGGWIMETSDPSVHDRVLRKIIASMPDLTLTTLRAMSGSVYKFDCAGSGCKTRSKTKKTKVRRKARVRMQTRRAKVAGVRVDVYRFPNMPLLFSKNRDMALVDALPARPVEVAVARTGKWTVVVFGGGWKKGLAPVLKALAAFRPGGKPGVASLPDLQAACAKNAGAGTSAVTAFSVSRLFIQWIKRCVAEFPNLAARARKARRSYAANRLGRMAREMSMMSNRWPAGGQVVVTSKRSHGRFIWRATIDAREVQSVLFPFMMFATRAPVPRHHVPVPNRPARVPTP